MTRKRTTLPADYEAIRLAAEDAHGEYPQYEGHWDGWTPGVILRGVRTKGGQAFLPGDLTIVRPLSEEHPEHTPGFRTCYSVRRGWNVSVPAKDVAAAEAEETAHYVRHPDGLLWFRVDS